MDETTYVYLIAAKSGSIKGPVKVGMFRNVESRIRQIQTFCPYKIAVVHHFAFPNTEIASYIETAFHAIEKESRMVGEWFSINPILALVKLTGYIDAAIKINLEGTHPHFQEESRRQCGVIEAKNKLREWGVRI